MDEIAFGQFANLQKENFAVIRRKDEIRRNGEDVLRNLTFGAGLAEVNIGHDSVYRVRSVMS